ncbi:MAG: TatD family hydrolase [Lachnospiraceae bacterium]|nr:TatD family hydrolase [Lachnospiraceae bacterium]
MIFDTHAHYDDAAFDEDRERLIESLPRNGISTFVNVSSDEDSLSTTAEIIKKYGFAYGAIGIHPSDTKDSIELFDKVREKALSHEKVVAIGEIGLDYHYRDTDQALQKKWFRMQMNLARELGKPVIIHSRDAAADTYEIMKECHAEDIGGVVHCFSYSPEMAEKFVAMGFFIGIGGVLTFKNAKKLRETVQRIGLERLVLETDCPYLAPEPHRGERNSSLYLKAVACAIGEIKGIDEAEVEAVTFENAHKLYRIGDKYDRG